VTGLLLLAACAVLLGAYCAVRAAGLLAAVLKVAAAVYVTYVLYRAVALMPMTP